MKIARILYPVTVLGPGKRIGIWISGCKRKCPGCANPELWRGKPEQEIAIENLLSAIDTLRNNDARKIDGITISGGEPFLQKEELLLLVNALADWCDDILIFTGFLKGELEEDEISKKILSKIHVLVDGAYEEENNRGEVLRGSSNQCIYYKDETIRGVYEQYEKEHKGKSMVENFRVKGGVIAVGIHKRDFQKKLEEGLRQKGIEKM